MTEPDFERYRAYLRLLADVQLGPQWRGLIEPSDLVQQTLLEAHRQRDQFRGQTSGELAAWLRQVLVHNLADAARGLARQKRDAGRTVSLDAELAASSARLQRFLAAPASSPAERVACDERAVQLAEALEQLPEAQRAALVLQHWHGRTLAEIGHELGKTPAAVAGLLHRGLKHLRERLPPE